MSFFLNSLYFTSISRGIQLHIAYPSKLLYCSLPVGILKNMKLI